MAHCKGHVAYVQKSPKSEDRFLFCDEMIFFFHRNGTSMISLIIPPKDQVSRVAKMLADEFGTASNIKSRVNR